MGKKEGAAIKGKFRKEKKKGKRKKERKKEKGKRKKREKKEEKNPSVALRMLVFSIVMVWLRI